VKSLSPAYRRALPAAVAGVLFVFAPLAAGLAGERAQPLENRPLADRPSLSAGWGVFDEASRYVQEHLPVRNAAVDVHGTVVRGVFGDRAVEPATVVDGLAYPSVVDGRNGWMYFGADFKNPCHPTMAVDRTVDQLARLAQILRDAGKRVAVVVVPDKSSVVVDGLPSRYVGRHCAAERKQQFWQEYAGRDPDLLDLRPALAKADQTPGRAYLKTDSHWTPAGSVAYAKTLVDHVAPGTWRDEDLRPGGVFRKEGDLAAILLDDQVDEVPDLRVVRQGVTLDSQTRNGHYTYRYRSSAPERQALVRGRTALVGDSFTYNSRDAWSPWFEQITTRHRANTQPALIMDDLVASQTVLFEVVERDAASGTLGVLDPAFLDDLEQRLAASP
jgi:alginate O-acetyltransferase complex protein AlgJ